MRITTLTGFLCLVTISAILLPATRANADPANPPIPYSGQLLEAGQPVSGNRWFSFRIYSTPGGGSSLYAQAESLTVSGGVYHTQLNTNASL